jgi:hypothetical protein
MKKTVKKPTKRPVKKAPLGALSTVDKASVGLGLLVRDRISGFTGIATSFTVWLTGCTRYTVCPQKLGSDGKVIASECFDLDQLEVVGNGLGLSAVVNGGPLDTPPRSPDPTR